MRASVFRTNDQLDQVMCVLFLSPAMSHLEIFGRIIWGFHSWFRSVLAEVVHEKRTPNTDAHVLDRNSIYKSLGRHVWFFDPPDGADGATLMFE